MVSFRRRLALCLATAAAAAVVAAPAAAADSIDRYVALGDSFTSGSLIPNQIDLPCTRSDRNYPSLVAAELKPAKFVDVSCGGATTRDLTGRQFGFVPPQYDALTAGTDLVTMGMGGNDVGFAEIVVTCGLLAVTNPGGSPCADHYGDTLEQRLTAFAPKLGEAVDGIRTRAPRARIVLVGYPAILPERTGCFPIVPIARGDVPFLDGVERRLNEIVAEQASRNGAEYVDTFTRGHDVCTPPGTKWVEGIFPTAPAAPVHPNALGMRASAQKVLAHLR
ncbi:SGNH/GDSL hydrolase family protein [Amycolatopsis suaedae]|uniref:SGNH/GDSL hydrolase family protein n=1 Tax=Amycolatopsis suaedae TaxID=2510978 RepID=A0A4Q7J202_9PSEU|nr:SGNH/GDSL hydrolase family protein [Amycolatopsis suaedae]RZQ60612.1 SGNH/GDSL hydrolase family protein [Amycolatopsis suaedae]